MKITACTFRRYVVALTTMLLLLPAAVVGGYIEDPDFGDGGVRRIDIGSFNDRGYAAAVQEDGRILVAGTSDDDPVVKAAVIRLSEEGVLDTTFQNDGKATFALGGGDSGANDVAVKADGSILLAGFFEETVGDNRQLALLQITPFGFEDSSFGDGTGLATLVDGDNSGEAFDVELDGQNRILVAGQFWSDTQSWAVVARYLANGTIDTSFGGGDGYSRIETDADTAAGFITVQSDGKIVVGGTRQEDSLKTAVLYRLNEDGSIDTGYGVKGEAALGGFEADSEFFDGVLLSDDSLVTVGYTTQEGRTSITAARFTPEGEIDASFGSGGMHVSDLGNDSRGYSITVKSDGTLLIAGEGGVDNDDIVLVHLEADGTGASSTILQAESVGLDLGGADGAETDVVAEEELIAAREAGRPLLTDVNGGDDSGRSVIAYDDNRVLVAGFSGDGVSDDMVVVAYTADQPPAGPGDIVDIGDQAYFVATLSVTNVTRNSAMTGGVISVNKSYECDDADVDDCPPAVVARGVAYGVTAYPSYREGDAGEDGGVTTTTTAADSNGTGTAASVFPSWVADSAANSVIVRRGQTEDGSGKGVFGSDITPITPDTFYFVRAYAVLADDTVLYGNQLAFKTDDACFIATAAYGSSLQPHVAVLGQFRDRYLKTNAAGKSFVRLYYHLSPELADFISRSSLLRLAVRIALLPLVAFSYFMVYVPPQLALVLLLLAGSGLFACKSNFFSKKA